MVAVTGMKAQLTVADARAEEAVAFYKAAFGAEEVCRATHPKRKPEQPPLLLCAELKIGAAAGLLVCDEIDDDCCPVGKEGAGAGGIVQWLETEDVQAAAAQAVKAGAALRGEIVENGCCCGGLVAKLVDPFGVTWVVSSANSAIQCA